MAKKVQVNDDGFFRREHDVLAKDLLGRKVKLDATFFYILEAEGYPAEKNGGLYEPVMKMSPGGIFCPKYHNHCLLLIACLSSGSIGGCVLVRAIERADGRMIKRPGLVAQDLGIEDHGVTGTMHERDGVLGLGLNGANPPTIEPVTTSAPTGVSQAEIQSRMGKIMKVYQERRKADTALTFEVFLKQCFACKTPRALGLMLNESV